MHFWQQSLEVLSVYTSHFCCFNVWCSTSPFQIQVCFLFQFGNLDDLYQYEGTSPGCNSFCMEPYGGLAVSVHIYHIVRDWLVSALVCLQLGILQNVMCGQWHMGGFREKCSVMKTKNTWKCLKVAQILCQLSTPRGEGVGWGRGEHALGCSPGGVLRALTGQAAYLCFCL